MFVASHNLECTSKINSLKTFLFKNVLSIFFVQDKCPIAFCLSRTFVLLPLCSI